jgi:hypothetical protein
MKLSLTVFLADSHLVIEADNIGTLAQTFVTARQLSAEGHLPKLGYAPDSGVYVGTDGLAHATPEADPNVVALQPRDERDTERPGKKPRVKKDAQAEPKPEEPKPEEPTPEEPTPEEPTPEVARKVTREEATDALTALLKDKGSDVVAALLRRFGVPRFGLYVADDYAEFVAAVKDAS